MYMLNMYMYMLNMYMYMYTKGGFRIEKKRGPRGI